MNRAERRASDKRRRRAAGEMARTVGPVPGGIRLTGGPMDGWTVLPGAPCLEAWWGQLTTGKRGSGYELRKHDGHVVGRWTEDRRAEDDERPVRSAPSVEPPADAAPEP